VTNLKSFEEQIYEMMKEKILNFEIKLGEQINIQKLSRELKVSTTPICGALKRLSQENLVKVIPRVGYYVVDIQPRDLIWIYDLRIMFESYALEKGINKINKNKLLQIKEKTQKLSNVQSENLKKEMFNKTDRELHWLIIESSPNKKLHDMYSQIYNFVILSQAINPQFERSIKEHLELIEAILKKDIEEAKNKLKTHINNAANDGVKALRKQLLNRKGRSSSKLIEKTGRS